ncbi:MAG: TrkH family potassium uptake protein [Bacteroidales bacterium]|nr:TrkH family potassium uptake protein [Bacteroidales bacterium]
MKQFNIKLILHVFGILLMIESVFMLLSGGISLIYQERDLSSFLISALITVSFGFILYLKGKTHETTISKREGLFIVAVSWILFSLFGMLPFILSGSIPSVTDSFFETMSGFTTTGASILNNIDTLPHGILFWRSLIQWLGGMGIIVFTLALMPMFSSGGIQLFNAEVPGLVHDKLRPRIQHTAKRLWIIYFSITGVCAFLLWLGPMNLFDSICHSFTTMATGGYSTKQASIAFWDSAYIEYIIMFFMFIAGINFSLVYFAIAGKGYKLFKDEEFKWYSIAILLFAFITATALFLTNQGFGTEGTLRASLFHTITIITTTGFAGIHSDYVAWGPIFWIITLLIMISGACAGSTSGGMKIIRVMVLFKNTKNEIYRQVHPNAIVPVRVNKHVISFDLVSKVLAFIMVYIMVVVGGVLLLTSFGVAFDTSIGATVTCVSNVGPGLGTTGPLGSFSDLPAAVKWILSFIMLIGRLELFTVLVIFTPGFWKK